MILAPPGAAYPSSEPGGAFIWDPHFLILRFESGAASLVALSVRLFAPLFLFGATLARGTHDSVGHGSEKRMPAEPADNFSFPGSLIGTENHQAPVDVNPSPYHRNVGPHIGSFTPLDRKAQNNSINVVK